VSGAHPSDHINVARRFTVLVVDDESSILRLLARSLDAFGYATLEVTGADDALSCMRSNHVDAAILDVRMPGGTSGLELLEALRADPDRARMPVLILTGVTLTTAEERRAQALGAHVFYKPQAVEVLARTLDRLLEKPQG
jgi:two-component system chemotaxis response regulator CheY